MDIEAKIKEDMRLLGCKCDKKISLAFHLYVYLVDDKLMYDTEYCYNKDIDTLYVVARPNKNDKLNIYVPIPTSQNITMNLINELQENLCTVETGTIVTLAFIESDFTTVLYTFTKGLAERQAPEVVSLLKIKEEKRNFINSELRKKRDQILNDALNGGVVDDDDCQVLD